MSDIRTPLARATVDFPGGVVLQDVTLTAAVGQYPVIQLNTQPKVPGESQAVEIFSSTATSFMGAVQNTMFGARTAPDVSVVMDDGDGNTTNTKGYSVSPGYSVGAGNVARPCAAVGEAALLSNLNPSIYRTNPRGEIIAIENTVAGVSDSPSPAVRLISIYKILRDLWRESPLPNEGIEYQIASSADRVNTEPFAVLSAIADNSDIALPSWEVLQGAGANKASTFSMFNQSIGYQMQTLLQMSNGDFLGTLQNFCSQFQLEYVPSLNGVGKFIRLEDKVNGPLEPKEAEVVTIDISAGNRDTLPVQQVLIAGLPNIGYNFGTVSAGIDGNVSVASRASISGIYAYPLVPYTGGKVAKVGLPPYCPVFICTFTGPKVKLSTKQKPLLDVSAFEQQLGGLDASVSVIFKEGVEPIIKRHARNIYADLAIGGSVINITTGLDLSWETGKRYDVSARGSEGSLFTGFLAAVTHSLSGGRSPSAITRLSFTHVQCSGFTLQLD